MGSFFSSFPTSPLLQGHETRDYRRGLCIITEYDCFSLDFVTCHAHIAKVHLYLTWELQFSTCKCGLESPLR